MLNNVISELDFTDDEFSLLAFFIHNDIIKFHLKPLYNGEHDIEDNVSNVGQITSVNLSQWRYSCR